jgi:FkbM family methyltransferase
MKFYGQFNPPVDAYIYNRYFRGLNYRGVFVECGAGDGVGESCCKFFEESMGWSGVNIEAARPNYERLKLNRPHSINLNLALSNVSGTATFTHAVHPVHGELFGNGSLEYTQAHMADLVNQGCTFLKFEVEKITWRELAARVNLTHVDLMVLDVEGHELQVLNGMEECSVMPDIMCIETSHLDFEEVRYRMKGLGYKYDGFSHVNSFFLRQDAVASIATRVLLNTIGR